ncbi:MAG: BspA family leucine-rich repeat surface protein [Lactobacillaceae bacterium]|jgi:surface protein|nr:BspA family leucine-rich repeat surface protein [Lactobacillaceae bacterium]
MTKFVKALMLLVIIISGAITPAALNISLGAPTTVYAASNDADDFGTCHWTLNAGLLTIEAGELGISGASGDWKRDADDITQIEIKPGVIANADSEGLFQALANLTTVIGGSNLDMSQVINAHALFTNCPKLTTLDVSAWDVAHVEDADYMFCGDEQLSQLDVANWDTQNMQRMYATFTSCHALSELDIANWNLQSVVDLSFTFCDLPLITTIDVSNLHTPYLQIARGVFANDINLTQVDLSAWTFDNVKYTEFMFYNCSALISVDLTNLQTPKLRDLSEMFRGCSALQKLDLSLWSTGPHVDKTHAFLLGCTSLWQIKLGGNFNLPGDADLPELTASDLGKSFDNGRELGSTLWREVGVSGDVEDPLGNQVASNQIADDHNSQGITHTYVWQSHSSGSLAEYTVQSTYSVTIPASIMLDSTTKTGEADIVLSANPKLPAAAHYINVCAHSIAWQLTTPADPDTPGVAYQLGLTPGGDDFSKDHPDGLTFVADGERNTPDIKKVYAAFPSGTPPKFKYAGTWSDIVTFTISTHASDHT